MEKMRKEYCDCKQVLKHLKSDIETFKREAKEDRKLIKELKKKDHDERKEHHHHKKDPRKSVPLKEKKEHKIEKVMREYKKGELHSGSKKGPKVANPKQAIAIALSEARRVGKTVSKKKK